MITIIFAPPRTGKTCFMTHLLNQQAFNRQRNRAMASEIIQKKNNGFDKLTIPIHCVSANYDMTLKLINDIEDIFISVEIKSRSKDFLSIV